MSGSISLSMSQQFDENGSPLAGGLLYFIQAGTTSTPQNAYQDSDLTLPLANPYTLDQAGRIPQFYLADGSIKIRLTDSAGVQQLVADNILVVGPSSGSGGGGSVDATTVLATGDVKIRYGTGTLSGFVRGNGRTIGSATSGATERANADTQSLFEYLWGADANLSVSGGRGASANADWTANKTIALPDCRGRVIASPDGMGNSPAGQLGSGAGSFGASNDTLGAKGGVEVQGLTTAQLPAHSHANTLTDPGHGHPGSTIPLQGNSSGASTGNAAFFGNNSTALTTLGATIANSTTGVTINNANAGSGAVHNNTQPTILMTTYIKL
jgi:microcystin-dependent protein